MRLVHPPSRLSPPPGSSMQEVPYNQASARESPTIPSSAAGSSTGTPAKRKGEDRVPKRGYRACVSVPLCCPPSSARGAAPRPAAMFAKRGAVGGPNTAPGCSPRADSFQVHCRARKAKCDLGDPNAPSEPPCSRCRREQRNCIFLPSVSLLEDGGVLVAGADWFRRSGEGRL